MRYRQQERLLFVCNNENQVKILTRPARILALEGFGVRLLSLDQYYDQNASRELEKLGFPWHELPSTTCRGRWYKNRELRSVFERDAIAHVEQLFLAEAPTCVVVGHDVEGVEQVLLRAAERWGATTVRVEDGLQTIRARDPREIIHRQLYPCEGGADVVCVWSEHVARSLAKNRGIHSKVVLTGNPRYDALKDWQGYKPHVSPYKALVAAQCFSRHLNMPPAHEIAVFERLLRQLISRRDLSVLLKLHPQQTQREKYFEFTEIFKGRVEVLSDGESIDLLRSIDVLITICSTVAVESTLMRIPTARLDHLYREYDLDTFLAREKEFLERLHSDDFPMSFFPDEQLLYLAAQQCDMPDGRAAERVADAIRERISEMRTARAAVSDRTPEISVLILLNEGESLSAVRSCLRSASSSLELIAVDRSHDGLYAAMLRQAILDRRLQTIHLPDASPVAALKTGIRACQGNIIARIHPGAVALPGWPEKVVESLQNNPRARLALSGFHLRDENGVSWQIRTLPQQTTLQKISSLEFSVEYLLACALWKKDAGFVNEIKDDDKDFELTFICGIVGDPGNPEKISVNNSPLFMTPFSETKLGISPLSPLELGRNDRGVDVRHTKTLDASVIVPEPESESVARKLFEALACQTMSSDRFEIVIAPTSSSHSGILSEFEGRLQLELAGNPFGGGPAVDKNTAIEKACGRVLVFLGRDFIPESNCLEEHFKMHRRTSSAPRAVLGALRFGPDIEGQVLPQALAGSDDLFPFRRLEPETLVDFKRFSTANVSLAGSAVQEHGLRFENSFRTEWGADLAFALSFAGMGGEFVFCPEASAIFSRALSIRDIIEEGSKRGEDLCDLVERNQELLVNFLEVSSLSPAVLEEWKETTREDEMTLEQNLRQIEEIQHERLSASSQASSSQLGLIIAEVRNIIRLLIRHCYRQAFVQRASASM